MTLVVALDGPAGTGKSTVGRVLAARLGVPHLDTGAMYRAVTWAALRGGVDPADAPAVTDLARGLRLELGDRAVVVDGVDATAGIRTPEVTAAVSTISAIPGVRAEMRRRQREWVAQRGGCVAEGRDIGTVVFPDARLKVFLTASAEVRARRRAEEIGADVAEVARDIARRDLADSTRADSPLAQAGDAVVVDTSELTPDQVVDAIVAHLAASPPHSSGCGR